MIYRNVRLIVSTEHKSKWTPFICAALDLCSDNLLERIVTIYFGIKREKAPVMLIVWREHMFDRNRVNDIGNYLSIFEERVGVSHITEDEIVDGMWSIEPTETLVERTCRNDDIRQRVWDYEHSRKDIMPSHPDWLSGNNLDWFKFDFKILK